MLQETVWHRPKHALQCLIVSVYVTQISSKFFKGLASQPACLKHLAVTWVFYLLPYHMMMVPGSNMVSLISL